MSQPSGTYLGVHVVGSAPVESAEAMYRLMMKHLPREVRRLPDGEVGERDTWIRFQNPRLAKSPQLQRAESPNVYVPYPPLELKPGVSAADQIELVDLGYAEAAIGSYREFARLQGEGVIPASVRFQVGLPIPLSVMSFYIAAKDRDLVEQAYERAMLGQVERMLDEIPRDKLAIQWEVVSEFAILEGVIANHLGADPLGEIVKRIARLVDAIPRPVEVGLHLCYGDSGHKHFCQPKDTGLMVDVTAGVLAQVKRSLEWVHLPVPKERDDEAFFAPLKRLKLPAPTELHLGLVHTTGGIEGTRRRIAAAKTAVSRFGIATECGYGRRSRDTIGALLDQHAELGRELRMG